MAVIVADAAAGTGAAERGRRLPPVLVVALLLVAVQLVVRAAVVGRGYFYWDDLILIGRSGTYPLLSGEFIGYDHDGHLMPGAFAVAHVLTDLFPLRWWPAALSLVVGQAVASLAVLRVLWVLLPRRVVLGPLILYLFTPLTLPAFAWWAAGLNSLPMQAALAWVAGDAVRLVRTGERRYAVSGVAVTALGLLFFEKAVLVPFVALVTVVLLLRSEGVGGRQPPVRAEGAWRAALRGGAPLWQGSAVVLAVWAVAYVVLVRDRFAVPRADMVVELANHGVSWGLLPTLLGGPWRWERWNPSPPWADPPLALVVLAWVAVAAALVWSLRTRYRTGWVWVAAAGYVAASTAAMIVTRSGDETAYELARTLRYHTDSAVVIAIAAALVLAAPRRPGATPAPTASRTPATTPPAGDGSSPPASTPGEAVRYRILATLAAALLIAGSLWSTATFTRAWTDNPTRAYLTNAEAALTARPAVPLLDQAVSVWILLPVAHPHNMTGHVFAALPGRVEIGSSTTEPKILDDSGHLIPADLFAVRYALPGPIPGCGALITERAFTPLPADGPLIPAEWTVQLNYFASGRGAIDIRFPGADVVTVPVAEGPGTVYARVPGGGDGLEARSTTPGTTVCVGGSPIGGVVPR
ncbi:hypothetical protein [Nocardia asteroides]|uniref:hypothetical protein n=1 Tax=Nocardia asteroides TaxID=1824 RepID=UPI001E4F0A39|nr:hypothetical protein [Nocardia asteroides]UGT63063.1 hypothetical protein LTT61_06975 [Nocardia asteroides]